MECKGVGGSITLTESTITIRRSGFSSFLVHGLKGDKHIPIAAISAVQFKRAGLTNGYIQFSLPGGNESQRGLMAATKDENTMMFTKAQQPAFEQLRSRLNERIAQPTGRQTGAASAGTYLDELERLASLRDRGALTDAEFEEQKKRILAK